MSERRSCGCSLCQIETELLREFLESGRQESCRKLFASEPELAAFAGVGPLLAHLRLCRDAASSDGVLRALLRAKQVVADGTVERVLTLAFLPHMHASVRSVLRRYPQLPAEDASQNVLHSLLRLLDSGQLQRRQSYLGFAVARRVKRAAFEWAEHELRSPVFETNIEPPNLDSSGDSFERLVFLRHFLDRAVRDGILDADELDLLIQFKLQNGLDGNDPSVHSNAHRQRMKRLVMKLRRVAGRHKDSHKPR
jgi:hypothetical protein